MGGRHEDPGLSASRIRQAYRVLPQIMRAAVDNEMVAQAPCRNAAAPHDLLIALIAYAGLWVA
ncbi:hypothetical protein [Streptomyces montanisoli]|uniref:hypothetical protein n=1 Tax=Streptomyces montanisoli TaxID=2798581 RepID=UPI0027DD0167|nr:hypothetical protein [Streptomyces montanisoli]